MAVQANEPVPGDAPEDLARRVAAVYSGQAVPYRDLWAPALRAAAQGLLAVLPLATARRIIDIGAGVGSLLPDLARAGPTGRVIGVDSSAAMLALAPREHPLAVMDAGRLALASASFDVAVLAFVLFHLPDPLVGLGEARRVLRPGGALGTITWSAAEPAFPAHRLWLDELEAHGAAPPEPVARHELVDTPEKVRALLDQAGFTKFRSWTGPFGARFDPASFLDLRTRMGSQRRRFESLPPDARASVLARLRERLARMESDDFLDDTPLVYAVATI